MLPWEAPGAPRHRLAVAFVAALVLAAPPAAASDVATEDRFVQLVNGERSAAGLHPLVPHWDLIDDARAQADRMRAAGYLFHNPGLTSVTSGWVALGENIGVGGSVDQLHSAFMAVAAHRANILHPSYNYVGAGTAWDGSRLWTSILFMDPAFVPPFRDDEGSPHEAAINTLAGRGVTYGCAAQMFCPEANVTQGQLSLMLSRALVVLPLPADPNAALTRAQAASLLVAAFSLPSAAIDAFLDDDGLPQEPAINALAAAGIVSGCALQRFCPARGVTRAETATLLVRALGW